MTRYDGLRGDHAPGGEELRLRHPSPPPAGAPGAVGGLRARPAHRRHRRRRRRAGAQARRPRPRPQGSRRSPAGRRRPRARRHRGRRPTLRPADGRVRRADRRAARWTSPGPRTRRSTTSSCTAGWSPGRSAGSRSRSSGPRTDRTAGPIADDLGVALQLTNILRDVVEDRGRRPRLPAGRRRPGRSAARRTSTATRPRSPDSSRSRRDAPREWFDRGLRLLPLLDHRSRACVGAMAGIYRRLLRRIELDPAATTRAGSRVPTWEKLAVAGQSLIGGPGREPGAACVVSSAAGWPGSRPRSPPRTAARP